MLPEIYSQLAVDKMFVMGDGQKAFSSLAESIIPFLTVLPEITGKSLDFSKVMSEEQPPKIATVKPRNKKVDKTKEKKLLTK
ncbi:MAG: hypothetical protein FK730_13940 [Asgard group archaeon]|nr:hypothetical protein [Asgard group archaeon]